MPLFLIAAQHRADSPFNLLGDPAPVWAALEELDAQMREAGVLVFSQGLRDPEFSVTFRAQPDGGLARASGPYGHGTLAGMWIVDCEAADAETWAKRCATAHRCDVELRPFQQELGE